MKQKKFLLHVNNSGLKETDGYYEVRFFGTKNFTFCFLRHEKHFCEPASGVAVLHPNEKEKRDEFTGCKIALVRAVRSFLNNLSIDELKKVMSLYGGRAYYTKESANSFRGRLTTQLINALNDKLNVPVPLLSTRERWLDMWDWNWEENND